MRPVPRVECPSCGEGIALPDDFPEGDAFVCARCGQILENSERARAFRWSSLDPYVRVHGASRGQFTAGLIGSSLWIVLLGAVLLARRTFDAGLLAALAVPYGLLLWGLFRMRARRPAALYMACAWIALGLYLFYLALLFRVRPDWGASVLGAGTHPVSLLQLVLIAVLSVLAGAVLIGFYRRRQSRLPALGG